MPSEKSDPAKYFGKQMKAARLGAGLSLVEFGKRVGYDPGQLSRIETGKRAPTELLAIGCDRAFPDKDGWFTEFWQESKTWLATSPFTREWLPVESSATVLYDWSLSVVTGLLQTPDYTRAIMASGLGVTDEQVQERVDARIARQSILSRENPCRMVALVDESAIARVVGSPAVMSAQLKHLFTVSMWPNVTMQLVPAGDNAGLAGSFVVAGGSCYVESSAGGAVFHDPETVGEHVTRFDSIRAEALPARETGGRLEREAERYDVA